MSCHNFTCYIAYTPPYNLNIKIIIHSSFVNLSFIHVHMPYSKNIVCSLSEFQNAPHNLRHICICNICI